MRLPPFFRRSRASAAFSSALAAAALLLASPSGAQEAKSVALGRLEPAPAGDRMFGVPSPYTTGDPGFHIMVLGDYAHDPVVLRQVDTGDQVGTIVSDQFFLHLSGTVDVSNRVAFNVDFPLILAQSGEAPSDAGLRALTFPSGAIGDLRLGARVRLIGEPTDFLQFAVAGSLWLPTAGGDSDYISDDALRGSPQLIMGGASDILVWSASVGVDFRPTRRLAEYQLGTSFTAGAGVGFLLGSKNQVQIGPEAFISDDMIETNGAEANGEALFSARARMLDDALEIGVGIGVGFSQGLGTPDYRGVGMVTYSPSCKSEPQDRDKDSIVDEKDACPTVAGVADADPKKNGCPPPPPPPSDRDKDSIIDDQDACPDEAGVASDDAKKNGCPPPKDRDKDSIIDDNDACPDVAGVASDDAKKNGCPPDTDGDGVIDAKDACVKIPGLTTDDPATNGCPGDTDGDSIRDDLDACVNDKGPANEDPKKNGCPRVRIAAGEVLILEQVQFDTDRATIKKVSDSLLDGIAAVLKAHLELAKIEVQGHTDNAGGERHNLLLSTNRANAVMAALMKRGIDGRRLTAKGYGQTVPIDTNDTPEGRQTNRRVQFKILERKAK